MTTSTQNRETKGKLLALAVLLAALAVSLMLAARPAHASTTFTVNSTEDHADQMLKGDVCDTGYTLDWPGGGQVPECTLRAAINQANYTPGADTVNFNLPTGSRDPDSGVKTIAPESALPLITEAVTINGYSQPGASPNTRAVGSDAVLKIELSGANAPGEDGLFIAAANSTVKGLVVNRWGSVGIHFSGSGATGNRVVGNYIGTDASGTQDLGNGDSGVYIGSAPNNTVGGTTPGARNIISGNTYEGVIIDGPNATGNKVTGNYVGTDKNGTAPLGNGDSGVRIANAPNNTVGGTTAGARNVLSGNERNGVAVYGGGATGNRILSNSIYTNGRLGIDLGADGPTANDPGDTDTGPNGLQNKPVLSSAKNADGKTTVRSKLNSAPNRTFKVQFFSNPSGTDEGKVFIGQKPVTTDGSGNVTFAFTPAQRVALGRTITATATSPGGSTSEFSAARTVISA